jgi:roadblock/LC7 domain-containing protein
VSEIEELVKKRGVLIAGRFAPDFQVAEQKTAGLFVETPKVVEYVGRLCATAHMMFSTLAFAADGLAPSDRNRILHPLPPHGQPQSRPRC